MTNDQIWMAIGFGGQFVFSARFLVQWLSSESAKKSVFPIAFWYLSIGGGVSLLAYAIHRRDPVFIAGQASGLLIYARNLQLIRAEQADRSGSHASGPVGSPEPAPG